MTDQMTEQNKDSILFASKASQLIQEQKIEQALSLCEAGVRQFPFYSPGHFTLALCYEALGKVEDAKNEYERTLVYDPSHNKAMRKLSNFYQRSGLDQLANEFLIKEALYSPLNPDIIKIIKEKNLYDQLNPVKIDSQEAISDVTTEVEIENEIDDDDAGIQNIEEIEEQLDEIETVADEENEIEPPEEVAAPVVDEEPTAEEGLSAVDEEPSVEEEAGAIDNLDPLAGEELDDEDNMIIDNPQGFIDDKDIAGDDDDLKAKEDFSPLMQGYLEKDDLDDDDNEEQWMEVDNLLNGEEEMTEADVDPVPDGPRDETEMLLEQLSHDDDVINLEAAVADPYDNIDLTSDVDKSRVDADDIDRSDLAAAVADPMDKTEDVQPQEETESESSVEEEGETISEIISEFEKDGDIYLEQESDLLEEEKALDIDEPTPDIISQEKIEDEKIEEEDSIEEQTDLEDEISQDVTEEEDLTDDADEEVTISDMLANPNLVTPTFGEILIAQHKFSEARHVFVELSKKEPENTRFMKKIQFLDKFLQA